MVFAAKWNTIKKKNMPKRVVKKAHYKPKHMLEFFQNGFWIVIVQKLRKKSLSHLLKMHCSVSGHVTLGMVRWRHELDYICPLWVLSKFGPTEEYLCRVIGNWFFPSNGIKRYFNGPFILFCILMISEEMSDVTLSRDKFYKATYLALISYYT